MRAISFISLFAALLSSSVSLAQRPPIPAGMVVGVETCRDCHEEMVMEWEESSHATSLEKMTSSDITAKIAGKLGLELSEIPMTASCIRCHFTQENLTGTAQTTTAVSCESCHGGALDWIEEHNQKAISREARIENSKAHGMAHPASVLDVSRSCFECHVIDDEQLVNHAGHPALTEGFELLSWYSGEVKHNFLVSKGGSSVKDHSEEPQPVPQTRKRMYFLSGKLLHLGYLMQSLASARDAPVDKKGKFIRLENGNFTYAVQLARGIKRIQRDMEDVLHYVSIPEYDEALALVQSIRLETGREQELQEAAGTVLHLAEAFCEKRNGAQYPGIDPVLEKLEPRFSGEGAP